MTTESGGAGSVYPGLRIEDYRRYASDQAQLDKAGAIKDTQAQIAATSARIQGAQQLTEFEILFGKTANGIVKIEPLPSGTASRPYLRTASAVYFGSEQTIASAKEVLNTVSSQGGSATKEEALVLSKLFQYMSNQLADIAFARANIGKLQQA